MLIPVYTGVFISENELYSVFKPKLSVFKGHPHITLSFRGGIESAHEEWLGEKVVVKVVGYGNNGKNEGLKVELKAQNAELQKYLDSFGEHHITLSCSRDSDPKFTANLSFEKIEKPTEFVGIYGAFTARGFVLNK